MINFRELSHADQIERWTQAKRVLINLSPHDRENHWNMSHFGYETECGTIACAAGHCGMDPWFNVQGFELCITTHDASIRIMSCRCRIFFGTEGANHIFFNGEKRSVETVIEEIQRFIDILKERFLNDLTRSASLY